MRLININTLELEYFVGAKIPPYVCLSHRWSDDELTFETYDDPTRSESVGRKKIENFCDFVRQLRLHASRYFSSSESEPSSEEGANDSIRGCKDITELELEQVFDAAFLRVDLMTGLQSVNHAWCDTVCIDKRSSAELSEAINSMGNIYKNCTVCVAYLVDVNGIGQDRIEAFRSSEWFTRCWTLQELIFPAEVIFCDSLWCALGAKRDRTFVGLVADAAGVPQYCLQYRDLTVYCVAQKMSWASCRSATRVEDEAYSLLGLFHINMPLLYGEGNKAFQRLQMEIIGRSNDESVFAWHGKLQSNSTLLASSARDFRNSTDVRRTKAVDRAPYRITNMGLEIQSRPIEVSRSRPGSRHFIIELNCARPITESLGPSLQHAEGIAKCTMRSCVLSIESIESLERGKAGPYYRVKYWDTKDDDRLYTDLIHESREIFRVAEERVFHISLKWDISEFQFGKFVEPWTLLGLEQAYQIEAVKRNERKADEDKKMEVLLSKGEKWTLSFEVSEGRVYEASDVNIVRLEDLIDSDEEEHDGKVSEQQKEKQLLLPEKLQKGLAMSSTHWFDLTPLKTTRQSKKNVGNDIFVQTTSMKIHSRNIDRLQAQRKEFLAYEPPWEQPRESWASPSAEQISEIEDPSLHDFRVEGEGERPVDFG